MTKQLLFICLIICGLSVVVESETMTEPPSIDDFPIPTSLSELKASPSIPPTFSEDWPTTVGEGSWHSSDYPSLVPSKLIESSDIPSQNPTFLADSSDIPSLGPTDLVESSYSPSGIPSGKLRRKLPSSIAY